MMTAKLLTTIAIAMSLTLGAAASIAAAQEAAKPDTGMMGGHGGMMGGQSGAMGHRGGMTGMMKGVDQAQMKRMVENCNRMMESMVQNMPAAPATPTTPEPQNKG